MLGAGGLAAAADPISAMAAGGGDPYVKSDQWDMSWIKRVNGKARGVFDIVSTANGGGWARVAMWHDQAVAVYGGVRHVSTVAVIRHAGIPLAMNDAYWEQFKPGSGGGGRGRGGAASMGDSAASTAAPAPPLRNPIAAPRSGVTPESGAETITGLLAAGGIVLACNRAFTGVIRSTVARTLKLTGDAADKKAREFLIPGVILMPSGIFGLIAAQQAGCGVCSALVPSMTDAS